jgi:uncharacterized repeat protein (TIGR01451 family)
MRISTARRLVLLLASTTALLATGASAAHSAVTPGPGWTLHSFALPTSFSAEDSARCLETLDAQFPLCDRYEVTATNAGSKPTDGSLVTLTDTLPAGVVLQGASLESPAIAALLNSLLALGLHPNENVFPALEQFGPLLEEFLGINDKCTKVPLRCELSVRVAPDETVKMTAYVTADEGAGGALANSAEIVGGGAGEGADEQLNVVSSSPPPFGASSFDFFIGGLDGRSDTQAGDHPYELTTTIGLSSEFRGGPDAVFGANSVEDVKDVVVNLPLGFVGSILAAPQCTFAQLSSHINAGEGGCPTDTIIGHLYNEPVNGDSVSGPIYNMVPERGVPAEFGYVDILGGAHVFYSRVVPSKGGYVLQAMNPDIPQIPLTYIIATFYGDPALRDQERRETESGHHEESHSAHVPFFTNPTSCPVNPVSHEPEALTATIYMDSWKHPARLNADGTPADLEEGAWAKREAKSPGVTGCDELQFKPELHAQPTTKAADTPSGLNVEMKLPQSEEVGVLATPTMKRAIVTLAEGFTVDPSAGSGLAACSVAQIGWLGGGPLNFSPAPPSCPEASKIGTLELETPLIGHQLVGAIFLASQDENPFHTTLAAYVVVDDPVTGVLIKIAGEFLPDPHTGRLTAVFDENPNLPFSDLKLHFFGGPRASLATPESCGSFTTATELTPWSAPDSGLSATPFESFTIDEACPAGFSPTFTAGALNLQAGAFTPFVASFGRSDTDQELAGLTLKLPSGLLAKVAGVPLCPDANAVAGSCPEASLVGTVQAGAGPGPNPLFVNGKAYLTGPYDGGPYGLSVVVPAVAGPYNFGTVVVRQSLRIDPHTAQVTDVSDPFPTIIDGIPLRLRRVDVTLDRPGFAFNPTSCEKEQFTGAISGSQLGSPTSLSGTLGYATQPGATSPFASPFQVTNCANLKFQPKVAVATAAKASKANGASLFFKIAYPKGAMGSQAWFNEAKFTIPRQLPARLTTIQQACLAQTFEANPAGCPAASKIGTAVVHTEVLPDPLRGPVYFVSHGGAKFPDAVLLLKGDGITFQLTGETLIKNGVTSATFRNTPDTPFESIEVTIPAGPFSEFGVNLPHESHNFCGQHLTLPTHFKASNGLEINQNTPVAVTGCPKAKKLTRKQKLAAALKACHKKHGKRRAACQRAAHKRYGAKKPAAAGIGRAHTGRFAVE